MKLSTQAVAFAGMLVSLSLVFVFGSVQAAQNVPAHDLPQQAATPRRITAPTSPPRNPSGLGTVGSPPISGQITVIVELHDPPGAAIFGEARANGIPTPWANVVAQLHVMRLRAAQAEILEILLGPEIGAKLIGQMQMTANAITVQIDDPAKIDRIRAIHGVKAVTRSTIVPRPPEERDMRQPPNS